MLYYRPILKRTQETIIDPHGFWITDDVMVRKCDDGLASWLGGFFEGQSVGDFGCGNGCYTQYLNQRGIDCVGYDGNPSTRLIANCNVADFTEELSLPVFDWVLCLEVAEHIPSKYEFCFLRNLHVHNRNGIILSWARRKQSGEGLGHVNCRDYDEVMLVMNLIGYKCDYDATRRAREAAQMGRFRFHINVFRRNLLLT